MQLPNDIDLTSRRPRTAIGYDTSSGVKTTSDRTRRVLLVGRRTSAGSVAANVPTDLLRETDAELYFGPGSEIDVMAKGAFIAYRFARITAVAVNDANGATAASQTLTFATAATAACAGVLRVGDDSLTIAVADGDAATVVAQALVDAADAVPTLPFTITRNNGVATITWKNAGTGGNGVPVSFAFSLSTALVSTTATPGGATLAGGLTDPSIATALAACAGRRYHLIALAFADATNGGHAQSYVEEMGDAENGVGQIVIQAVNAGLSTSTTLAASLNGARSLVFSVEGSSSPAAKIAAAVAATMSSETDPARPYNTLPVKGVGVPAVDKRWTKVEQDTLLAGGCSPLIANASEVMTIQRAVSTRVKNDAGLPEYTLFDITIIQSLDYVRDLLMLMFSQRYARSKWADDGNDGLLPSDVATPAKIKADVLAILRSAEREGVVQNVGDLATDVVVEKVGTACHMSIPADVVDGLHELLGKLVLIRGAIQ